MTAEQIYSRFKELCPNSADEFSHNPTDIKRWMWHIEKIEQQPKGSTVFVPPYIQEFFDRRAAATWEDLPVRVRVWYDYIKSFYPDADVFAVGSYVNGDYITPYCPDFVKWYREKAGKSDKTESDFDYYTKAPKNENVPGWADYSRYVPGDKMILIPMWDFEKIPESERPKIGAAIAGNRWDDVAVANNKYKVSTYPVCCDLGPMKSYYISKSKTGFFDEPAAIQAKDNGEKKTKGKKAGPAD